MTPLKSIDRKALAAYQRYYAELQDHSINIDELVGDGDLIYFYDLFLVKINKDIRIDDWLLTPKQMDRVFFYATRTIKRTKEMERQARKCSQNNTTTILSN